MIKPESSANPPQSRFRTAARALRHRNFRLFFAGQGISVTGSWMQRVAESWLAYHLSHSAWILGLVTFVGRAPALLGPLGGGVADRVPRHRLVLFTQSLLMIQAFALAWFTLAGWITPRSLVIFSLILGLINAVDNPGRQSFFVEMVGREDLPSAIALNSSLVNAARVLGPVLAGLIVAWMGEGLCFLINGISFIAVLVCLLAMQVPRRVQTSSQAGLEFLREGLSYAWEKPYIRETLFLLGVVSFAAMPYVTLLPIFTASIYHGGAATFGWLMGVSGAGAVCGVLWLASRPGLKGMGRSLVAAALAASVGLLVLSLSRELWLSMVIMPLIGGGILVVLAGTNTLIQSLVPDGLRGRVMGLYAMTFLGVGPFGSLLAGWTAGRWGAPVTIFCGALICAVAGLTFAFRLPIIRQAARSAEKVSVSEAAVRFPQP